jgi:hypothetical protein
VEKKMTAAQLVLDFPAGCAAFARQRLEWVRERLQKTVRHRMEHETSLHFWKSPELTLGLCFLEAIIL